MTKIVLPQLYNVGLLALTVLMYWLARAAYQRSGAQPMLIPIFTAVIGLVAILYFGNISYPRYAHANQPLEFLIGPATVALALPLYTQLTLLRRLWLPLTVALVVGGVSALVSATVIAWAFGAPLPMILSLAPKSATMPVALPASELLGGIPSLAAVAVAVTGVSAVIMARPIFRLVGVSSPLVRGFTIGLTAHAIGTARAIQVDPQAGAAAALAMGLNGLLTAGLMPWLPAWLSLLG